MCSLPRYTSAVPSARRENDPLNLQLIILPATHVVLFIVAALVSLRSPFGLGPVFCADLPISLPLVARDDWPTVFLVGVLGTAWWFFVGKFGQAARQHRIGSLGAGLGAILIFLTCVAGATAMEGQISQSIHDERFSFMVIALFMIAGLLLVGGFANAAISAMAAFTGKEPQM